MEIENIVANTAYIQAGEYKYGFVCTTIKSMCVQNLPLCVLICVQIVSVSQIHCGMLGAL